MYAKIGGWIGVELRSVRFVDPGAAAGFVMEGFTGPDLGKWGGGAAKEPGRILIPLSEL